MPAVLDADGAAVRLKTRKHLALLIYLALERRRHRRDALALMFWPDIAGRTRARHSLAVALSSLRGLLGSQAIDSDPETVRLVPGSLPVDVHRLEAGDVVARDGAPALEVAVFCDEFDLDEAPAFMHWADAERARLLPLVRDALVLLMERCRSAGAVASIEPLADRLLSIDSLSEEGVRAKMEARSFVGDRTGALRAYEQWREALAREVQAHPSASVAAMARRLRGRGIERPAPDVPAGGQAEPRREQTFVGRLEEFQRLDGHWANVRSGVPGWLLVHGEPGIGKSAFAARFCAAAALEGAAVARVQCHDVDRDTPYSAFVGLLEQLLERPGASAAPPDALAELARICLRVVRRFPGLTPALETSREAARLRLAEAAWEVLAAISEEQPVILVIDDAHHADESSLTLLHLMMRRAGRSPVLACLVTRNALPGETSLMQRLLVGVDGPALEVVELGQLSEEEGEELLGHRLGGEALPPTVRRSLVQAAAGYPALLELLAGEWREHGPRTTALAVPAMTTVDARLRQALAVRRVLARLQERLDAPGRRVLDLASMLGRRLDDLALYRVAGLDEGLVLGTLTELTRMRVLRDGTEGLEFSSEVLRTEIYAAVPQVVREAMHVQVGDALMARAATGELGLGLAIAWHCLRARRTERAWPYLLVGAREGTRWGSLHEVERALESAARDMPASPRGEATLLLGENVLEQGRPSSAITAAGDTRGDPDSDVQVHRWLTEEMALWAMRVLESDDTEADVAKAIAVVRSNRRLFTRVWAARVAAGMSESLNRASLVAEAIEATHTVDLSTAPRDQRPPLLLGRAMLHFRLGDREGSERVLNEAIAEMSDLKWKGADYVRAMLGRGVILCQYGKYEEAIEPLKDAFAVAKRVYHYSQMLRLSSTLLACNRAIGRLQVALTWLKQARKFAEFDLTYASRVMYYSQQLLLFGFLDKRDEFEDAMREGDELLANRAGLEWLLQEWNLFVAEGFAIRNWRGHARRRARAAVGSLPAFSHRTIGRYYLWRAVLAADEQQHHLVLSELAEIRQNGKLYDAIDALLLLRAEEHSRRMVMQEVKDLTPDILRAESQLPVAALKQVPLIISCASR